ncbi:hypothetical protein [Eisenibacter elegans]|uniref:hypothetical protein n=1 Tax=Eisenibacter elegans TaxID=997 RepID=UPI001376D42F|nr:hypothetical protein [Eisenibacter elegans]
MKHTLFNVRRTLLWSIVFCAVFGIEMYAQQGRLFLHNYTLPFDNFDTQNQSSLQMQSGEMLFANTRGILHYNGTGWNLIPTQGTPYTLRQDTEQPGRVWVGGDNYVGYLARQANGALRYYSLPQPETSFEIVTHNAQAGAKVYFATPFKLLTFDVGQGKWLKTLLAPEGSQFAGLFVYNKQVYVHLLNKGLHRYKDGKLEPLAATPEALQSQRLAFSRLLADKSQLLGTQNGKIYRFDGQNSQPVVLAEGIASYLQNHLLSSAVLLDDKHVALGTRSGGCVIVNLETGQREQVINYETKLPDDDVQSLAVDRQGGLWICHALGISRADFNIPVESFSAYPGLVGSIQSTVRYQDKLYVGTTAGLYVLEQTQSLEDINQYLRKEKMIITATEQRIVKQKVAVTYEKESTKVSDLINKTFGKNKVVQTNVETQPVEERVVIVPTETNTQKSESYEVFKSPDTRRNYALESFPYYFKKVEGVSGKCRVLYEHNGQLLVGSSNGLFLVSQGSARSIIGEYVQYFIPSPTQPDLFYVATLEHLFVLQLAAGQGYNVLQTIQTANTEIASITIDTKRQMLWMGGRKYVLAAPLKKDGTLHPVQSYTLPNSYAESIVVSIPQQRPTFFTYSAVYEYHSPLVGIVPNFEASLQQQQSRIHTILYGQPGYYWQFDGVRWRALQTPAKAPKVSTDYLGLFRDIQHIYVDGDGSLWVSGSQYIYKIRNSQAPKLKEQFTFINSITDQAGDYLPKEGLRIQRGSGQEDLTFHFHLANTFYLNETEKEYSYRLEGKGAAQWTPWSTQHLISLPLLAAGKYTLHVRSKNTLGQIQEIAPLQFQVVPPFWETWWFYGLETLFFAGLVFGSYLLSKRDTHTRRSQILTILTLITFFEFFVLLLEPWVESFSGGIPFFKLGMNVLLAASLYPVERFVRIHIFKQNEPL